LGSKNISDLKIVIFIYVGLTTVHKMDEKERIKKYLTDYIKVSERKNELEQILKTSFKKIYGRHKGQIESAFFEHLKSGIPDPPEYDPIATTTLQVPEFDIYLDGTVQLTYSGMTDSTRDQIKRYKDANGDAKFIGDGVKDQLKKFAKEAAIENLNVIIRDHRENGYKETFIIDAIPQT